MLEARLHPRTERARQTIGPHQDRTTPPRVDSRGRTTMANTAPAHRVDGPGPLERARRAFLTRVLRFPPASLPAPDVEYAGGAAARYDEARKSREVFNWEERIVGELLGRCAPGTRVLDVPVGTGRFIPTYVRLGLDVVGLDASVDMLAEAARTFDAATASIRLVEGSATDLPFADDAFDALVSFRFLPGKLTLRQTRRALREYARVTSGELYILLKDGDRLFPASWRDEFSILGVRPEPELRAILEASGLRVERIERAPKGPKAVFVCRRR